MVVFTVLDNGTFFSSDYHFSSDSVNEWIFIQRVKEAVKVFAFVPDDFCCCAVDDDCE
jgi:hypothetical protein